MCSTLNRHVLILHQRMSDDNLMIFYRITITRVKRHFIHFNPKYISLIITFTQETFSMQCFQFYCVVFVPLLKDLYSSSTTTIIANYNYTIILVQCTVLLMDTRHTPFNTQHNSKVYALRCLYKKQTNGSYLAKMNQAVERKQIQHKVKHSQ